jgi:hypothetical protein
VNIEEAKQHVRQARIASQAAAGHMSAARFEILEVKGLLAALQSNGLYVGRMPSTVALANEFLREHEKQMSRNMALFNGLGEMLSG